MRSDTFKIRFYGQYVNPVTGESAEAYGEAVVQRSPDFMVATESADTPLGALNEPANITFGRRFVLVDFQWLNKL